MIKDASENGYYVRLNHLLNSYSRIKEMPVQSTFQRKGEKKVNQFNSILAEGIFPRLLNPSMCQAAKITLKRARSVILEIIQEANKAKNSLCIFNIKCLRFQSGVYIFFSVLRLSCMVSSFEYVLSFHNKKQKKRNNNKNDFVYISNILFAL